MKRLIKLLSKPDSIPLLIVIFFGLLAGKGLMGEGYFNMHDDLQMMRQLSMEKCFLDGQIPCRWIPDMGYGYGYPLFNFYPPLPYLIGQVIRLFGFSFVQTAKYLFIVSFVASGVSMYYLAKEFFGKLGGIVSAIFYVWAPYHAVDVYVRGAMNEAWALIWFPAIFYFGYKLTVSKKENWRDLYPLIIGLALTWFGLFTSHNLMVLIFTPFFGLWILMWMYIHGSWKKIPVLFISGLYSFALAAFFTLPVLVEKSIVQTDTLVVGYYEYTAHFPNLNQLLFSRFWGWGPSVWMAKDDGMSFQIGWIHWISSLIILFLIIRKYLKTKKLDIVLVATGFFVVMAWMAAFMAHPRSTPIWKLLESQLQFVQFPWRFLTLVILGMSFAAGAIVKLTPKALTYAVSTILILLVLIYSWNYFIPENGKLGPLTDEQKFTGAAWDLQRTAGIYDYLPNTAFTAPKAPPDGLVEFIEGEGEIRSAQSGTDWMIFQANVSTESAVLRVNQFDFPEWEVTVNGQEVEEYVKEGEEWGRFYIDVNNGLNNVEIELQNTPIRLIGNYVSLISWLGLIASAFYVKSITQK